MSHQSNAPREWSSRGAWPTRAAGGRQPFFVAFDYPDDALPEIDAFFRKTGNVIVALTVREIPEEVIARKLA